MSRPRRISELLLETSPKVGDLLVLASDGISKRTTIGSTLNSSLPATFGTTVLGNTTINGDLDVNGNLRVSSLVSSSILYESGSTLFGNSNDDTHKVTGSLDVTGSFEINGSAPVVSGSISGSQITLNKSDETTIETKIPPGLGYSGLGWARYDDTTYTTGSSYSVASSTTALLPCNGSGSIETHMHSTVPFYNPATQKIQAENDGDVYSVTIDFSMRAASNPSADSYVRLQMNNTTGTPYTRVGRDLFFQKNSTAWHSYHEIFQYYADVDFVANGNEFNIVTNGIGVEVADVIIFIQRTQNHSQH